MADAGSLPTAGNVPRILPRLRVLPEKVASWPLYVWLLIVVLLPNVLLIGVSFLSSSSGILEYELTLENYQRTVGSNGVWVLLGRTLMLAGAAAFFASLIAYPMAYYASRILRRGRLIAVVLVVIPLWISLLMRVFAWRLILGETGVLNSVLVWVGILDTYSSAFLYNQFAVLLTFTYLAIPYVFVSAYSALERIPSDLLEASSDCGASPLRTFREVTWPLSRGGLTIGFAVAFLLAVGDYVTPSMVGGLDGTMIGMVIASQFGLANNWPYGAALACMVLACVLMILAVVFWFVRTPGTSADAGRSVVKPAVPARTPGEAVRRAIAFCLFLLPYIFLYAPLVIITIFSFADTTLQAFPVESWTFRWYVEMTQNEPLLAALRQSLFVGASVVALATVIGTSFAILMAYRASHHAHWLAPTIAVPIALPGVVLGITLVLLFQLVGVPAGTLRVILGHLVFVMPVVMMIVASRLRTLDPALAEASADLGATRWQTLGNVVLPLLASAIFGGALLGFTLSVDEVVVTLFLTGIEPTLPVWVWNQMRFGFNPSVNAIFVLIGVVTLGAVLLSQRLFGRAT